MEKEEIVGLVEEARKGNQEAFGKLYEEFITPIYRFVYFQVKHKSEAEDITQTVFVRALGAVSRYEDEGLPFSTWLYTIARNLVIDYWKKKKDVLIEDPAVTFGNIHDPATEAHHGAERRELGEMLAEALKEVSPEQREILVLQFMDDLSNREIAEITGKNEDAIRALKHRGLKSLRKIVEEKGYDII